MTDSTGLPTTLDLGELRRLLDAATPGPWRASIGMFGPAALAAERPSLMLAEVRPDNPHPPGHRDSIYAERHADAELVRVALNALPALLDEIDRLRGSGAPAPHYWSGDRGAATGGNVALPGDRAAQVARIASVLPPGSLTLSYGGTATEAAQVLFDAGLRVGADPVGGLGRAWAEAEAALPDGWHLRGVSLDLWGLTHQPPEFLWFATAGRGIEDHPPLVVESEACPTPTLALHALALALGSEPK